MKAIQFAEYGTSEVLKLVDVEAPQAGPGQVRIAVRTAGVNPLDWRLRSGYMKDFMPLELPSGVGFDAAGVIDQVGDDVTGVQVGDAVFGNGAATYAEFALLDAWAALPEGLDFTEAAGFPVPVGTALRIIDLVGVEPGQTLLVSGASGGVGSAALQIARERGISVIATASTPHLGYLRSLGAAATTYGEGLVERVRALAPGRVDAALHLAGAGIPELIELTGDPTKVVTIVDPAAAALGVQFSGGGGDRTPALEEAARLYRAGALTIPVQQAFPLADAAAAQDASATGHVVGRFVVIVS